MGNSSPRTTSLHRTGRQLSILGIVLAVFSVVVGLLVLFVIPGGCAFLGGLELVILAGLLLAGVFTWLAGRLVLRRANKAQTPEMGADLA
jgi:hypothetical protein